MKLISWNVNGIRAIEKKGFLEWLKKTAPDILCLQEIKADRADVGEAMLQPAGYTTFWSITEKKGYSGVAVYSKTKTKCVTAGLGIKQFDVEGRVQIMEYDDFILFNVYFPNGGQGNKRVPYKMAFYDAFLDKVEGLKKKGKKIIVCGDVNTAHTEIDLARPRQNEERTGFLPEERAWVTKFIAHGYIDTFRYFNKAPGNYSWWDYKTRARERDVGWRIDYFFISENLLPRLKNAFILKDVLGSDHCPVGIEID